MAEGDVRSNEEKLIRFLKTGTERNFFLPGKNKSFRYLGNVVCTMMNDGEGQRVVECIKRVHADKLYHKREPLLFILAQSCHAGANDAVKKAAYDLVNEVCANPVDLFTWLKHIKICSQFTKGWGSGLRRTVNNWYNSRDPKQIAEFVTRYTHVERWSHKDVFRLSHIKPKNDGLAFIVKVVCKGLKTAKEATPDPAPPVAKLVAYFDAVEYVKHSTDGFAAAMKLEEYELHKEYVPMALLSSKEIWNSLLLNMTVKDVMTSLPALGRRAYLTMPARGTDGDPVVREIRHKVLTHLQDMESLESEQISPFFIYIAIRNYVRVFSDVKKHGGKGGKALKREHAATNEDQQPQSKKKKKKKGKKQDKGQGEGVNKEETDENKATEKAKRNNPDIYEALHKAFRAAVEKNTPTTGKSYLLALKASSSEFQKGIRGTPSISAIEVMALMATILKKKESSVDLGFFTASLTQMKYPAEMENIIQDIGLMAVPDLTLACDPASPVTWALEKKRKYDVILVMSDGHETEGETSPGSSLVEYRQKMKLPNTKMVICGLASPKLEFATEPGMLDIGGFDATVPKIISEFVTEKLDTL
ncbi:RNA-binding protein RO60-like isoform X2 [Mya arenaria]|nr:RNA-binding protein RO60-like isoform X2 [Mya arenaria]XP_052789327.1 RNA-binding protein RO60-like isoform X2 [Mya arenaria]XP_052789328.1 RNA-binding protein RO60-like isoform X2 [Mya arenaria]XP_052789329.1 RNA-binding protein RO60-like isoform X2 [Mya arenaria]